MQRPDALVLSTKIRNEIVGHLQATAPAEGVGLIGVPQGLTRTNLVAARYYPGTNRDDSPTRYTMAPDEVLRSFLDMEQRGWSLGAIVHSHPVGPATPSLTDRREFHYPEALMVIVSLAEDKPGFRAWWFGNRTGSEPVEVPVLRRSE